ncbi:MAG: hypothetical protein Q8M31_21805 [Beijerinckiaceae bacterium]|nr:hypothetical protein [Beijerinckiaceae bacterium]
MPRGRKKQDTESAVQRVVNADQLVALVKWSNEKRGQISELSGEIGERVKYAADNGNLHRGVFALVCKLKRMDEYKRNDFLRQFNLYLDMCREKALFGQEHAGDLLDATENEEESEEEDIAAKNAAAIEKGIKPLPDEEKEFDDSTSSKPSRKRAVNVGDAPSATRIQ